MVMLCKSVLACAVVVFSSNAFSQESVLTIEDYNEKLPIWGTSWTGGAQSINGYYPSFYTGFAPRQQRPNRIHIRLSRGNQTRTSVILDDQTVLNYLYDLKARNNFYTELLEKGYININPKKAALTPHVNYFRSIVNSGAALAASEFDLGQITKEALYTKSLEQIKKLNPGRVFDLNINLAQDFLSWRDQSVLGSDINTKSSTQSAMVLANKLLWGRINLTRKLKSEELSLLSELVNGASVLSSEAFVLKAYKLFSSVTDKKYDFKVLDSSKKTFVDAKICTSVSACKLTYSEMSAVYPTGTLKASTKDRRGNSINRYATPGLHNFIDSGSRGDVDNIRKESYYGFAPKMDYEGIGNGFHNPAVRLWPGKETKKAMRINPKHATYWPVKRGRVSHGCARLPLGHVWEMRGIFPVQNKLMKQVYYFGNDSRDFDVFDINGDGSLEVMGVKYYIQFNLKGASGLAKREGQGLNLNKNITKYFKSLYGQNKVFAENAGVVEIYNPVASIHTIKDKWSGSASSGKVVSRKTFEGAYALYEQDYEQDKAQFYTTYKVRGFNSGLSSKGNSTLSKRFVRLLGRVRGCAPFADKEACGETAFQTEKAKIFKEIR
jgi:hypothetical protein